MLFSSNLTSNSPNNWGLPVVDHSAPNTGSFELGNSTSFSTRYNMTKAALSAANLPARDASVQLTCFTKYNGDIQKYRLDQSIGVLDFTFKKSVAIVEE
mmetsp:Transcript_14764/g.17084  ORF Transcript_14764/g.17084 Transcript_14764/m.17084 type:complete len:99 (-) Transcript_14764:45-341(-)